MKVTMKLTGVKELIRVLEDDLWELEQREARASFYRICSQIKWVGKENEQAKKAETDTDS